LEVVDLDDCRAAEGSVVGKRGDPFDPIVFSGASPQLFGVFRSVNLG
jgi:hypothetical protein